MKYMIMMFGAPSTMLENQSREWITEMFDFMHRFNADLTASGELVDAEGLADASQAKTVSLKNGIPVATDGPYAESKESLAGYWIVDVDGEARAIELASRVVAFIGLVGAPPIEIRQIMDAPPEL
ncbi:MAG TPA: YciI family protein [Chloroflexota bacterium]|nr:YciI family protein [Chloroflexota bacterium]